MSISRLWVDKYIPKTPDDIIGNKQNIKWMTKWLNHFMKKEKFPNFKNGLLISGDPGIGKTSAAHALLKHFGFDIVESGPLVRSSYHADEQARLAIK